MNGDVSEKDNLTKVIKRCSCGDRNAQEYLFRTYYGYVMGIALRYSGNSENASEITNDSFLKIFSKIESHNSESSFKAWIRKIAVNTSLDYYRREKKHKNQIPLISIDNEPENNHILENINAQEIISLLDQLPVIYRYTFNLYEIEGYSHDEIADQLSITASTSRSNLTRAKKMLRQLILKNVTS
jgi:RNA polymerase sigma factor (sigma-70 family)